MSTSEDENVPDAATAQARIKEFEHVTNTDEAFAQYCLQENNWDLTQALNAHFSELTRRTMTRMKEDEEAVAAALAAAPKPNQMSVSEALDEGLLTLRPPESLNMVTWNIDGLDKKNLKLRTKGVIKILQEVKADIVFLQEVIPETFSYIESKMDDYDCVKGNQELEGYFVATMLRRGRIYRDNVKMVTFPNTSMGRHLLAVAAHCGKVKFDLLNTHLESTKEFRDERMAQLTRCFDILKKRPDDNNVIFGGDLNLRDSELDNLGGIPDGTVDCWAQCGRRKELEFTWDMTRNTNLEWPGKFKPRLRFDRLYLRRKGGAGKVVGSVECDHFGLVGLQKIATTQSFPSDHWGILVRLSLDQGLPPLPPTITLDDNDGDDK